MKSILCALALALLSNSAGAGITSIAQLPLLNINGSGAVKPNLMLLYDNSGSMASTFTPDYIDDSTTCRARSLMSGGTRGCTVGHPPFNSPDFNRQYYNPAVLYSPPVRADGTSYNSLNRANTNAWASVTTDPFGVNDKNLLGTTVATTNLVSGFPDVRWCDTNTANCVYNSATYSYPSDTRYTPQNFNTNPYYYNINVAEYCTDAALTNCQSTAVGAAAPAGYPFPAKVRWCDSTALTRCQAKYVGTYKYPRFSNPNGGFVAAYGTITIGASDNSNSLNIDSVSVVESGTAVVITTGPTNAPSGTNSTTRQATLATLLAQSIINKTGLVNQYTACVRTPTPSTSSVPACSTYGITLGTNSMVAVVPLDCTPGATSKTSGQCSLLPDTTRNGWPVTVQTTNTLITPAQAATALLSVSGIASSQNKPVLSGITLGGVALMSNSLQFALSSSSTAIASAIRGAIGTSGTVTAYIGGTTGISDVCTNAGASSVCLVNSAANAAGQGVGVGSLSNNVGSGGSAKGGSIVFSTASSTAAQPAVYDMIQTSATPIGAGAAVFVRVDIVPTRTSYPKDASRTDCAGATCTYDEEMTNFANWYGYYKTRNQMMKTAVGQAFQPITADYNVGLVALSVAAADGAMTRPRPFSGTSRSNWYNTLYAMDGNQSTPLRPALHAVGKLYANLSPYVAASGDEVVQYPCQQNFTFLTTDGYWNGNAAATVTSNDNVESATRFCFRAKGCVDPSAQTANSLADVALYWYNGGSNTAASSLRSSLEDWTRPGLVPAPPGENNRLHMNTYTLGLGVDGIMTYERNYDTAATIGGDFYKLTTGVSTGCPWNNGGAYVWPDPLTGDSSGSAAYQSRVDDLWHTAINGHGKYFSASDPKQVVDGLRTALSAIQTQVGAAAAAATSTPNISQQDNDIFVDVFTTVKWYGELSDKRIDVITGAVSTTAEWNSSNTVGTKVASATDTRVIKMLDRVNGGLKDFSFASMTATEQSWFANKCSALAQCNTLSTDNRVIVNNGATIVNWLRGQQQYANDALLRAYSKNSAGLPIVLGDIASSKPAYLRDPRKSYPDLTYGAFKTANATRAPVLFVGANDGMLHAFNAKTGEEKWAYAPRITMSKLYLQASTTYGTNHQYTVDGSPEIGDAKIGTSWRSVLVAGLNGGGRGYYALDVTDPANPVALWETCADPAICPGINNEPEMGLTFGNPQIGTWRNAAGDVKWVVFVTSGYNNVPGTDGVAGGTGKGWLMILDIATGQVLAKVSTGSGDTSTPSGLARLTAITTDPSTDSLVTVVYAGDNLGQMWRFDFSAVGAPSVVKMGDAGASQPITTRPDVTFCKVTSTAADGTVSSANKVMVAFGTGRLLDVPDVSNGDRQSIYVLRDSTTPISAADWRSAKMQKQTLVKTSGPSGDIFTGSSTPADLSTKLGWYADFDQNVGERVNLDPRIVSGGLNVVTNVPSTSSACSVGGTSNVYQFDVCSGVGSGATLSSSSAAVGFIIVSLPNGTKFIESTLATGENKQTPLPDLQSHEARRTGWRRIRN